MLNWRLSLPSLRRCRSEKSDRDPKEESLSNAYPGTLHGGSEQGYTDYLSRLASGSYPRRSGKTYARREPFLGRPRADSRTKRGDFRLYAIVAGPKRATLSLPLKKPQAFVLRVHDLES
jgi:hypothetical protein